MLKIPSVQNYVGNQTTKIISNKLNTEVSLDRVDINLFKGVELENFYMEDLNGDTLIYAGSVYSDFYNSLKSFYYKDFNVNDLNLANGVLKISRNNKDPLNSLQRLFNQEYDPYAVDQIIIRDSVNNLYFPNKPKKFELNLNRIKFQNIKYVNVDSLYGTRQYGLLGDFVANFDTFQINELYFVVQDVKLKDTYFEVSKFEGDTLANPLPDKLDKEKLDFIFKINNLSVDNSDFEFEDKRYDSDPLRRYDFDPLNQVYNEIHIKASDLILTSPYYVTGAIQELSVISGDFSIESCKAEKFYIQQRKSGLENFEIRTGKSILRDNIEFKYRKIQDWRYFVDRVIMEAEINRSVVSLRDLVYFAPQLKNNRFVTENINEKITLSSRVIGRVNQMNGRDLSLTISNNVKIDGSFIARDLTDPDETLLNISLDNLETDITTLNKLIPGFNVPDNFYKLNSINFNGRFDGYYQDFVAYGDLVTDLGRADVDMRLNLKNGSINAQYSGKMNLFDFDLAKWANNNDFDKISLSANVENGKGLDLSSAYAELGGEIISFDFKGYEYKGIIDAKLEKNLFDGAIKMDDENVNLDFLGSINFKDSIPLYDFEADVEAINLKKLNLSKDITHVEGIVDIKLKGSSIDDVIGSGLGNRIVIVKNTDTLDFGHLAMASTLDENNIRSIFIDSDAGNAEITGVYKLTELPDALISMVKNNYPAFANKLNYITGQPTGQVNAEFSIKMKRAGKLISFFTEQQATLKNIKAIGNINLEDNNFNVDLSGPGITFGKYNTDVFDINFDINNTKGHLAGNIDSIFINKLLIKDFLINGDIVGNTLHFDIKSSEVLDSISNIAISGNISPEDSTFLVDFENLNFDVLGDTWRLSDENTAEFGKEYLDVKNFVLTDENRSIRLTAINDNKGISSTLKNVQLFLVNRWINKDNFVLNGNVNAEIAFENIFNLSGLFVKSVIKELKVNEQFMGEMTINALTDLKTKTIAFDAFLENKVEDVKLNGTYGLKSKLVNAELDVEKFKLVFLENFLNGNIENTQGIVQGKMNISGPLNDLNTTGNGVVYDGYTQVNYLGTKYSFDDAKFKIKKNFLDFTGATINDSRDQSATVRGGLTHDNFRNLGLDVNISSDKFTLLNTDENINPSYYGLGIGEASVDFQGPFSNMKIVVNAITGNDSDLTMPVTYVNSTRDQSFIPIVDKDEFILNYYSEEKDEKNETEYVGLTLEMYLTVNPQAQMTILFDPATGHKITGTGTGDIQLFLTPNGDINMYGYYNVDQGKYDFALQNFIKKEFSIRQDGQVLWSGDPLDAQINISADYRTIRAPLNVFLAEFLGSNEELAARASQDQDVKLTVNLIDKLLNPTIKFDIDFPNLAGELRSIAENKLTILQTDPLGLNNQVFGLLIFNNFLPYNNPIAGFDNQNIGSSFGVIVSELFSAQLSAYVSSLLESVLNENGLIYDVDVDVRLDNNWNVNNNSSANVNRAYGLTLNPKFNNDNFDVILGGDYLTSADQNDPYAAGDFIFDYYITEDKKIKIRVYGRTDRNAIDGRRQRIGAGLYVRREFASFRNLKKSIDKIAKDVKEQEQELND